MNLDDESLYLLDQSNKARLKITEKCLQDKIIEKQQLLEELLVYSVALNDMSGSNLMETENKNNLNICKLLSAVITDEPPKKTFKIPEEYLLLLNNTYQKQESKQEPRIEIIQQNKAFKVPKQEQKNNQKQKGQNGFITANLLQKNKQPPVQQTNQYVSPFVSVVPSQRKKFVPPFKKQEPLIIDRDQEKPKEMDSRYKNLDPKLVESIESQILDQGSKTKWSDIAGLGFAKKTIHEMIVWPMLRPDIFTGIRAPPKGVLLFGPPGTGKTLIGKAIASESGSTFFNISASSLTSKWVGQGQKMVKTLFAVALVKQPSVIFIDEIDSLLCSRSENQQQSSRRIKTEFLVQLDGAKSNTNERILIIGATNRPNELDEAVRRRFVKKLYIPLPNRVGRQELFKKVSRQDDFSINQQDIGEIAKLTVGYSGADLHALCSEASLIPLRKVDIHSISNSDVPKTGIEDLKQALSFVKATVNSKQLGIYQDWNKQFGSYQLNSSPQIDS